MVSYLFMLGLEGVVVAYDTARFWAVLGRGSSVVCQMTKSWKVLLDIQYVGVSVHALQGSNKL